MKRGLTGSAILHASVIALVLLGLPEFFKPEPRQDTPVVFEVVTVTEKATAPTQSLRPPPRPLPKPEPLHAEAQKPEPPKPEPPKPEPPKPEPPKPEPPKPEPPKPEPPKPPSRRRLLLLRLLRHRLTSRR
ncbi:hypothetical protein STVA_01530 [Allostella vacuolata]|nr:hypothetical protein STVA_01530 [Stella vacuolata]